MFRVNKKVIGFAIFIILGFVLLWFLAHPKPPNKPDSVRVNRGTLEEKMTISGKIDAQNHVILQFQTPGKLAWVGVLEGDSVKKYQAIASLDQVQLQRQLQKYLNLYMTSRWTFDQTKDDYKETIWNDTIKRLIDQQQFSMNNTVLDVEIQNEALRLATIVTPIDGIVIRVDSPNAGVNITVPSQAEIEIVDPATIFFSAIADQTEVTKIHEGLAGTLSLDSYPDETLTGKIDRIAFTPKEGETSTVYTVKFLFNQTSNYHHFKLGMTGDVSFVTSSKKDALTIPSKFIKYENGNKYVTTIKNGKSSKISVTTGLESDSTIEILSGVSEGEIVYD